MIKFLFSYFILLIILFIDSFYVLFGWSNILLSNKFRTILRNNNAIYYFNFTMSMSIFVSTENICELLIMTFGLIINEFGLRKGFKVILIVL